MKRITTKEVGELYRQEAIQSSGILWAGAAKHVWIICEKYHRARARQMLERLASEFSPMAISSTYKGAANSLR